MRPQPTMPASPSRQHIPAPTNTQRPPTDAYQRVRHSPRPTHGTHTSLRLTSAVSTCHGPLPTCHDPFRCVLGCPMCPGPPMRISALLRVPPHPSMAPVPSPPSPAAHAAPSAACPDIQPPPPLTSPLCTPLSASPSRCPTIAAAARLLPPVVCPSPCPHSCPSHP